MAPLNPLAVQGDWLGIQANRRPNAPFIRWGEHTYSFATVSYLVSLLCVELAHGETENSQTQAGIVIHDPFLISLLILVCARMGWPVTVINPSLPAITIAEQVEKVGITLLLSTTECKRVLGWTGHHGPVVRLITLPEQDRNSSTKNLPNLPTIPQLDMSRLQGYVFTSGSFGPAKAIPITFGQFYWSTVTSAYRLGYSHADCWLHCLPLYHIGGLTLLFRAVLMGFSLVLQPGFHSEEVLRELQFNRLTLASFVPTMLVRLLDAELHFQDSPTTFRFALLGGAKVSNELREECYRRLIRLVCSYGQTESCSHITTTRPGEPIPLGEGQPLLHAKIAIKDEAGSPIPANDAGRIWVKGPQVCSNIASPSSWHETGDIGYLDDKGSLHVLARQDEVYVSGGENVYAPEVTAVIESHPAIRGAWVTGIENREWGHIIVALAEPRPQFQVTASQVREYCRRFLPSYKVPKEILLVASLPLTGSGKVQQSLAQEMIKSRWH